MKNLIISSLILLVFSCSSQLVKDSKYKAGKELIYVVNLNDRDDDTFKVKLFVNNLKTDNAIYQFAASAPGTYETMDIGRFVRDFEAYDIDGHEIYTKQLSTNQWKISEPAKVALIRYKIAETWDTPVDSNWIYPMCGTSLEDDHALMNGEAVFGYPTGMQKRAVRIKLLYPENWTVGTALNLDSAGFYDAKDYDQVVDSPILAGTLTEAGIKVQGSQVEVYTYSQNNVVQAQSILSRVNDILNATAEFTNGLPVKRYTFLFHYENKDFPGGGAWEHNYSSIYTLAETPIEKQKNLERIMAHEFFHIVTPLNIHSELIEHFNFVKPQPSEHLWLYEATTEWAAQIMQLRANLIDLDQYLKELTHKLIVADHFRKDYSLTELSLNSFSNAGRSQYVNIYDRGAIIIGLLDIRLLELSKGKRGMREVINELSKIYGPEKSFDEKTFFKTFTDFTYPEIADFIDHYIKNAEPLPIKEYYAKLGINYDEEVKTNEIDTTRGYRVRYDDGNFIATSVDPQVISQGLSNGDEIIELNDEMLTIKNIRSLFNNLDKAEFGKSYNLKINNGKETKILSLKKITHPLIKKHIFTINPNPSESQQTLRNAWIRNL